MIKIDKGLKIEKKKNTINTWIEIECPEKENEHIKNMLGSLKKENRIYYLEEEEKYIYNISKFIYLKEFLENHSDIESIIRILKDGIKVQEDCINYLIPLESILFDFHHSFIEKRGDQLDLIILPIDISKSDYQFKEWISEMISFLDSRCDSESKEFLDKLFTQINMSSFCLNSLKDFIEREENKISKKEDAEKNKEDDKEEKLIIDKISKVAKEDIFGKYKNDYKMFENHYDDIYQAKDFGHNYHDDEDSREAFWKNDRPRFQVDSLDNRKEKKNIEDKNDKKLSKIRDYKYFYLILFQILMFAALALLTFYLIGRFSNPKKAISGVLIIWGLINYFSSQEIIKLANKRETMKRKEKSKKNKKTSEEKRAFNVSEDMKRNISDSIKTPMEGMNFDTELLNKYMGERFYLKNLDNRDVFLLNKNINLVGRKFDDVDIFLDDKSASRIHAAILLKNDKVYLQDNNSLNGSYINYNKIEPNESFPLKVGDEISFSRQRYKLIKQSI